MKPCIPRFGVPLALALAIFAAPAMAQGRGNDRSHDRAGSVDAQASASVRLPDRDRDRDLGRTRGLGDRPPGWGRGRKTGWGDCNLPPGQAKKYGCHRVAGRTHRSGVHASGSISVHRSTNGLGRPTASHTDARGTLTDEK
jgi:hypothetical protein